MYSDKAERKAKGAKNTFMDSFHDAEDCVVHSYDDLKSSINSRPLKSAVIALGIGFLLGKIL